MLRCFEKTLWSNSVQNQSDCSSGCVILQLLDCPRNLFGHFPGICSFGSFLRRIAVLRWLAVAEVRRFILWQTAIILTKFCLWPKKSKLWEEKKTKKDEIKFKFDPWLNLFNQESISRFIHDWKCYNKPMARSLTDCQGNFSFVCFIEFYAYGE